MLSTISPRLIHLQERIKKAAQGSALASHEVILLGASKGQGAQVIEQAIDAGLVHFGENRVQEAAEKWPGIKKRHPAVRLHLIGPLQSNKVKAAAELFDVIQTVDRLSLAEALSKTAPDIECYIQVNTGKEEQKAGVMPEEADGLIERCRELGLNLTGLMCIPPADQPGAPHFALLRQIAQKHGLTQLSMGMSEDFETAVRMGSSCVRIGRALFGERA